MLVGLWSQVLNKCTWTSPSSLGGEICFKGGAVLIPVFMISWSKWCLFILAVGLTLPTVIAEYNQKRPGLTVTGSIFLWSKITVGDRDSNHMFFIFFFYQVGILLLSFKQTLEWLFQWRDGPWCHTAAQISDNLIKLLQSNGMSLSSLCTQENGGRENLCYLSKSVHQVFVSQGCKLGSARARAHDLPQTILFLLKRLSDICIQLAECFGSWQTLSSM